MSSWAGRLHSPNDESTNWLLHAASNLHPALLHVLAIDKLIFLHSSSQKSAWPLHTDLSLDMLDLCAVYLQLSLFTS